MTVNNIEALASLTIGLRAGDIAAATLDKLRLHVADTIGAWIAAAQTPEGKLLITFRNRRCIGDALAANLATNCALARLSEIDDIHLASMTTPGSIVIPAAMTLAAALPDVEMDAVAPAMLAGYEAMIRLGLAIKGPDILYRGIWPTYFAAGFATAAVAARLMRLDEQQTAQALALALTMAAPAVGPHHAATTARWFLVGNAARSGLAAATAAQAGFTTGTDILGSRLFPGVYGIEPDFDVIRSGEKDASALTQVSFKPWCAARQTMAPTQALREILDGGVTATDISDVDAIVLPPHLKMIDHEVKSGNRASLLTSLPYQLAMMALRPDEMLGLSEPAPAELPRLQKFMTHVRVIADDGLLTDYPKVWAARIVVTTSSGRHERQVHNVPGDPARPFTEAEVRAKFQRIVTSGLGATTAGRLCQSSLSVLHSRDALLSMMQDLDRVMVA